MKKNQISVNFSKYTFYLVFENDSLIYLDVSPYQNLEIKVDNDYGPLLSYLSGHVKSFNLDLNPKGTEFQRLVWKELLNIPYGKTVSYSLIAQNIGRPNSVRAVANAIGKNPIMILIPCHRVIGKNGTLTGFSGGLELKQFLLDIEKNYQV